MANSNDLPLVVFSDDWGRHPSSSQHLVRNLPPGFRILWVNTVGTRRVRANAFTVRRGWEKLRSWRRGLRQVDERMWVVDVPMWPSSAGALALPINRASMAWSLRRGLKKMNAGTPLMMTTLPHIWPLVRGFPRRGAVYYCVDDFSQWPDADRDGVQALERTLVDEVDAIRTVSTALADRFAGHRDCAYLPHGVDFHHFASTASVEPERTIAELPAPRVGFFGLIYEKLDFELLRIVAESLGGGSLVMIGRVDWCPDWFRALPNVRFVGPQPYAELPRWLAGLDVLLIPYADDPMIRQGNPLKLRECLASGKPTVSIDVPEARPYEPHVRIGRTSQEFVEHVQALLARGNSDDESAARRQTVAGEGWESRAAELAETLCRIAQSNRPQPV